MSSIGADDEPRGKRWSRRGRDRDGGFIRRNGFGLIVDPRQVGQLGRSIFERGNQCPVFDVLAEDETDLGAFETHLRRADQAAGIIDQAHGGMRRRVVAAARADADLIEEIDGGAEQGRSAVVGIGHASRNQRDPGARLRERDRGRKPGRTAAHHRDVMKDRSIIHRRRIDGSGRHFQAHKKKVFSSRGRRPQGRIYKCDQFLIARRHPWNRPTRPHLGFLPRTEGRRRLRRAHLHCARCRRCLARNAPGGARALVGNVRWLGVALVIDAIDGPMARWLDVVRLQPNWSGDVLDLVVDFVTYVFVPPYAITASRLLLPLAAPLLGIGVAVSGALYFADQRMKRDDDHFRGFPGLWNAAAFYLFLLHWPPALSSAVIAA